MKTERMGKLEKKEWKKREKNEITITITRSLLQIQLISTFLQCIIVLSVMHLKVKVQKYYHQNLLKAPKER